MEIVEILSTLRHCTSDLGCDTCPMRADVERRIFCVATLLKESKTAIVDLLADIDAAKRRCAQAQAERDALLEYAKTMQECEMCKNDSFCHLREPMEDDCQHCQRVSDCPCQKCEENNCWEWRGVPEAPEGGTA